MRQSPKPLQKHTVNLYEGDFARLRELFPQSDTSLVLRNIVRKFIERVDAGAKVPQITENLND